MKIGVVSLYYNNHNIGGLLQSYAVIAILKKYGYEAEQICYDLSVSNKETEIFQSKRRMRLLLSSGIKIVFSKAKKVLNRIILKKTDSKYILNYIKQDKVFDEFEKFIPHSEKIYNINTIKQANKKYDMFVTGSDQVWNPGQLAHDAFYLTFTDANKKKIAFAVSMGKSSLSKFEKKIFLSKISDFKEIGVREKSLHKLINSISTQKCTTILDPTLLLGYDKWKQIENNSVVPNEKYIFCYFLGDSKWQRILVQQYADRHNLKIVDIPYIMKRIRKSDEILKSDKRYDVGPREFIALVANAQCIFTDSFHAVAFSVNFRKNFYVFDRDGMSGKQSINSRITDFLKMLSIDDRRIFSSNTMLTDKSIDYSTTTPILKSRISETYKWLEKQLLL